MYALASAGLPFRPPQQLTFAYTHSPIPTPQTSGWEPIHGKELHQLAGVSETWLPLFPQPLQACRLASPPPTFSLSLPTEAGLLLPDLVHGLALQLLLTSSLVDLV